jgi:CubicO group peptidase (beta-lactamase class C family)
MTRIVKPIDGTFTAQQQGQPLRVALLHKKRTGPPKPEWASYLQTHIGQVAGYAFVVAHHDKIVAEGAAGHARAATDPPATPWTVDTRINVASVSKCITAVAMLRLMEQHGIKITDPFYPHIKARCPTAGSGVATVTFQNLLEMKSGLVPDGTLWTPDLWAFFANYLQQPLSGTPGVTEIYSNTNFTLMQGIISLLVSPSNQGGDGFQPYVQYVTDHVLKPMNIHSAVVNPVPDPVATATLSYAYSDPGPGVYWSEINCVGAGGWVSSARELMKFLIGVRKDKVLNQKWSHTMFMQQLGWYEYNGVDGNYFDHNGWLHDGGNPDRGLNTGIVRFSEGYDALLLVNTQFVDTIGLLIGAFEQ